MVPGRRRVRPDRVREARQRGRGVRRHVAGLVRRPDEEADVVDHHVAHAGQEVHRVHELQARREVGEPELRAGGDVVDDLQDRRALGAVPAAEARLQIAVGPEGRRDHAAGGRGQLAAHARLGRRRQVAGGHGSLEAVDAVGDHADRHPAAVDAVGGAQIVEAQDRVTRRQGRASAHEAVHRRRDRPHTGQVRDLEQNVQWHSRLHGAPVAGLKLDDDAQGRERGAQRVVERRDADVRLHPAVADANEPGDEIRTERRVHLGQRRGVVDRHVRDVRERFHEDDERARQLRRRLRGRSVISRARAHEPERRRRKNGGEREHEPGRWAVGHRAPSVGGFVSGGRRRSLAARERRCT